jgi:hypothetical protein
MSLLQSESPNDRQEGGDHYKVSPIQHWDFAVNRNMPYLMGQITKYITRARRKNGVEDLLKCQHFLEKLIDVNKKEKDAEEIPLEEYCDANGLNEMERQFLALVTEWDGDATRLVEAYHILNSIIHQNFLVE